MKHLRLFNLLGLAITQIALADMGQEYHWSMLGHYNLMEQKPQESQAYYQKLFSTSPSPSLHAYSGYVELLFAAKKFSTIISLLPKIEKTFENNLTMQLMFAQAFAESGNQEAADLRFINLQQKYKENAELTYLAALAHAKKDANRAIQVIKDFLNSAPFQPRNCLFYFMISQLEMTRNNKKEAIKNVQKSLEICPRFDKGWLLLGMIHEQEGKINEAIKGYSTFLELAGPNKVIEQQMNSLLIKSKFHQSSATSPQKTSYLTSALTWYESQDYPKALSAINRCLEQEPNNQEARLLKINILSATHAINDATKLLQQWMCDDPSNEAWFKALHLLYKAGLGKDAALAVLHAVEQKHPHDLLVILYLADAYTRAHLFTSAVAYHEKALTLTNDPLLKTKISFNMAMIHYEKSDIPAMKEALDHGLRHGAVFPPLYNLVAYYYATHGRDAARAQQYLNQALANDKNNPHFLDTQAMIWYKQRDYQKAEDLLKKLAAQEPKDHFIQLHLAKTEQKLGKQKQSMATLNRALSCAQTDHERTVCKKLLRTFDITS